MTITYVFESKLYVNITNRCPNNCEFCLRNNTDSVGDADTLWLEKEPSREEILNDILKRNLNDFPELVFCGYGEPTCRLDDMLFVCSEIKKHSNIKIRVNTNGLSDLINSRKTAKEFDKLVDKLSISLNASSKEEYDKICHSEFGINAFDAILSFSKDVSKYVPEVCMSVVDYGNNEQDILKCQNICDNLGIKLRIREYIN